MTPIDIYDVIEGLKHHGFIVEKHNRVCAHCPFDRYGDECETKLAEISLKMIEEMLEKQIPKQIERISIVEVDGNTFHKGFCPVCNEMQYGKSSRYCDKCGQAIKWE